MEEELLVELLMKHKLHITTAESCTAGLISSTIVNVANASSVFDMSFVTYANDAKEMLLGVKNKTIKKYGVVSEEVAGEMAKGAAINASADCAVAVSGIAGPSGGSAFKPVGMVCFGFYINGDVFTCTNQFGDIGRNNVRKETCDFAICKMIELIKEKYND